MHKKFFLPHLLLYTCLLPPPTPAADGMGGAQNMASNMFNMMEAMGQFSRDYVDARKQDAFSQAWEAMSPGGIPAPLPLEPEVPGAAAPAPGTATGLDGDWLGAGGERLTISGSRFRLLAGADRQLEGLVQTQGRMLALYSPQHRKTWYYEYAQDRGRLALRSADGQLLLFRRGGPREGVSGDAAR